MVNFPIYQASRDQIERLFGQQRQGVIIRASEEQLQALSEHCGKSNKKGYGSKGPFDLLGQKPIYSNEFSRFFQASPEKFKQLQDLGVSVTIAVVNQGSIMVPHHNSKSTTMVLVVEGKGWFKMACPHLALARPRWGSGEQEEEEQETVQGGCARYQKVTSELSPGDVLVIPVGHPIAIVAKQNENLRMVGFGINVHENQQIFLVERPSSCPSTSPREKWIAFSGIRKSPTSCPHSNNLGASRESTVKLKDRDNPDRASGWTKATLKGWKDRRR
ncbi:hypothetical protein NL676_020984 [Syzygium grande]|nr:hypothetical protein NL676_020984 [Syzygium grande]